MFMGGIPRWPMRNMRIYIQPELLSPKEVDDLVQKLRKASQNLPLVLLYLHGAHAQGTQTALSDLDIAALLDKERARDRNSILDLLDPLQRIAGREDIDLLILNTAGPIIKDRVIRYGRLVYARSEKERILFEASSIKESLDFHYFSRIYDDALFTQIAEGRYLD